MTLTKNDLIEALYTKCDLTRKQASNVTQDLLETIKQTLEQGEGVLISGFGKFNVLTKNPRRGRNPATGNDITLGSRRVVTFKSSDVLRRKLNNEKRK